MLRPTKTLFTSAMAYSTYRLTNQSTRYKKVLSKKIGRFYKSIDLQLGTKHIYHVDLINFLSFLSDFMLACDMKEFPRGCSNASSINWHPLTSRQGRKHRRKRHK